MTLVYAARVLFMAAHIRNLLEAEGIRCVLRNEFICSVAGEMPVNECWPEVWVIDDLQAEMARALIAEATRGTDVDSREWWRCSICGEGIEGIFGQCWNCGALRRD